MPRKVTVPKQVTNYIKFSSSARNRSNWYRVVQYFLKWYVFHLQQNPDHDKDWTKRMKNGQSVLGASRKLYRVGKYINTYSKAYELALEIFNTGFQLTIEDVTHFLEMVRQFLSGIFFWYDMLTWMDYVKLRISSDRTGLKIKRAKVWFARLVLAMVVAVLRKVQYDKKLEIAMHSKVNTEISKVKASVYKIYVQFITATLNLTVPGTQLDWMPWLNSGHVGQIGVISSLVACWSAWPNDK